MSEDDRMPPERGPNDVVIPADELATLRRLNVRLESFYAADRGTVFMTKEYRRLRRNGISEEQSFRVAEEYTRRGDGPLYPRLALFLNGRREEGIIRKSSAIVRKLAREQGKLSP